MSCDGKTCTSNNLADFTAFGSVASGFSLLQRILAKLAAILREWQRLQLSIEFEKARQRKVLLELDDRLLRDIGVTREQAEEEGRKPFWE